MGSGSYFGIRDYNKKLTMSIVTTPIALSFRYYWGPKESHSLWFCGPWVRYLLISLSGAKKLMWRGGMNW